MNMVLNVLEVAIVPVVIALIAVWRRENKDQHDQNSGLLEHLSGQVGGIDSKIDRIDERVDNLQTWAVEHEKAHLLDNSKPNARRDIPA